MKIRFVYKQNGELIDVIRVMMNNGEVVGVEDINGIIELKGDFDIEIHE